MEGIDRINSAIDLAFVGQLARQGGVLLCGQCRWQSEDVGLGGSGNDSLSGAAGNDTLIGGAQMDTFVFAPGGGTDLIRDFSDNVDTLHLSSRLWTGDLMLATVLETFGRETATGVELRFGTDILRIVGVTSLDALLDDVTILA